MTSLPLETPRMREMRENMQERVAEPLRAANRVRRASLAAMMRTVGLGDEDDSDDDEYDPNGRPRLTECYRQLSFVTTVMAKKRDRTGFQRFVAWYRLQRNPLSYLIPVDLSAIYREHLVWAKNDGGELLRLVTSRFSSTTVFLSLLLSAELGTFFSPSSIVEGVRVAMRNEKSESVQYWAGIILSVSIFFTIGALIASFSAWSLFSVVSPENAATVLRSSIGLYAAQLPARLAILSMYVFFVWVALFWWIGLPRPAAFVLSVAGIAMIVHVASTFSGMGMIIMHTSAMSDEPILEKIHEEALSPGQLNDVLEHETHLAYKAEIPVTKQYRMSRNYHEVVRDLDKPFKAKKARNRPHTTFRRRQFQMESDSKLNRAEEGRMSGTRNLGTISSARSISSSSSSGRSSGRGGKSEALASSRDMVMQSTASMVPPPSEASASARALYQYE